MTAPAVNTPPARTGKAAIVASTPDAAKAGQCILAEGGNAVDAAVAACLALCVSDPANLSIAGRCHVLMASQNGEVDVIDGASQVPTTLPAQGPIPIPGLPAALSMLHDRHGRLAQTKLFEPAIRLANDGFTVSAELARIWQRREPELALNAPAAKHYLLDGRAPLSASLFQFPALAELLVDLQDTGLDSFYRHSGVLRDGPWSKTDLRNYEARTGTTSGLALGNNLLLTTGPQAWGPVLNHLTDMLMNAQDEPDTLLRTDFVARCCATALRGYVSPGQNLHSEHDTTHLVAVDEDQMMVSLTASIGPHFGAKKAHPSLGFLYPWSYQMVFGRAPGRRDVTEMTPAILFANGKPRLAIGAAGSERIPQAVAQTLRYRLRDGLTLDQAVEAPRVAAIENHVRFWRDAEPELLSRIERLGWRAERAGPGHIDHVGIVHAAEILDDGSVLGVADSAYDGTVAYS